ncbi:MAG: hypothetical protein PHN88_07255 [Ignavibacteria bacterium]|nr:hypothetical protein [Ignavibacteria bacterium]
MKKLFFLFAFLGILSVFNSLNAQTLYFCEGVDKSGYPITESSTFNIPSGGGYFYFLVRLPYEVGCTSVSYDIYNVSRDYSEDFSTSIIQDGMGTDWVWFYKKVTFYDAGYYHVYVRDCYGATLASAYVTVKYK